VKKGGRTVPRKKQSPEDKFPDFSALTVGTRKQKLCHQIEVEIWTTHHRDAKIKSVFKSAAERGKKLTGQAHYFSENGVRISIDGQQIANLVSRQDPEAYEDHERTLAYFQEHLRKEVERAVPQGTQRQLPRRT
jgi:hypothetical protein